MAAVLYISEAKGNETMRYAIAITAVVFAFFCASAYAADAEEKNLDKQAQDAKEKINKMKEEGEKKAEENSDKSEVKKDAEEKAEEPAWWTINVAYQFSHNVAKERKSLSHAFSLDPAFDLPFKFKVDVHLGFSYNLDYDRVTSSSYGSGFDVNRTEPVKDFSLTDMDPFIVNIGRPIYPIELMGKDIMFTNSASLAFTIPGTSKYAGQVPGWRFAYKPGLKLGFKIYDFTISNKITFQQNFHSHDYRELQEESTYFVANSQFIVADATVLTFAKWGFSAMASVAVKRVWLYNADGYGVLYDGEKGDFKRTPRIGWTFAGELGYSFSETGVFILDKFGVSLGFTTDGPERHNGGFGDDRIKPFDPLYTQIYFGINASI